MTADERAVHVAALRFVALNANPRATRWQLQQAIDALTKAVGAMREPESIKAAAE